MLSRTERLALLTTLLGEEAIGLAREGLTGDQKLEFEAAVSDFESYPPSKDEIDLVIDDFENYFNVVIDKNEALVNSALNDAPEPAILRIPEEQFELELEPTKRFEPPDLTGDSLIDLNRMHPYQVAYVLKDESPGVVALVVRRLAEEHAAKTLELLPEPKRPAVFIALANSPVVRSLIEQRVFDTVLQRALRVEERQPDEATADKMANLMRSIPKAVRAPMMEELEKQQADLAAVVKKQLYRFEDLLKLDDQDLQKLLGQCQTDMLVVALQKVDPELLERILGNMSKRAKESLQEEMEFKANAKQDEIDAGRNSILKVVMELDESGQISME